MLEFPGSSQTGGRVPHFAAAPCSSGRSGGPYGQAVFLRLRESLCLAFAYHLSATNATARRPGLDQLWRQRVTTPGSSPTRTTSPIDPQKLTNREGRRLVEVRRMRYSSPRGLPRSWLPGTFFC
jgi:hypothetical protein